jgi:hypothetical protein
MNELPIQRTANEPFPGPGAARDRTTAARTNATTAHVVRSRKRKPFAVVGVGTPPRASPLLIRLLAAEVLRSLDQQSARAETEAGNASDEQAA